ncbi:MAG: D-tyrosyl-tRNA(Tyr) deacylase [Duncaniella sp.]|nr:D-tyrosyl-tRNA(Tyr) deacylase [Duncaniella sp.]
MKVVIQRVTEASLSIGGGLRCAIGRGLMVLVGVATGDTEDDARRLAAKTVNLRIFDDEAGVMNLSLAQTGGEMLAVSQFTLLASTRRGNRPSYIDAAPHELAIPLYELYCAECGRLLGRPVETGVFGADMQVGLVNDGPVTIVIDSRS